MYTMWAWTFLCCSSSLQILKFGHHNFYRNMTEMITIVFFIKDLYRETSSIESEPAILLVLLILQNETSFQTYFSLSLLVKIHILTQTYLGWNIYHDYVKLRIFLYVCDEGFYVLICFGYLKQNVWSKYKIRFEMGKISVNDVLIIYCLKLNSI